jgi:DNA polymerase V
MKVAKFRRRFPANRLLKEIFRDGYGYQKCGVQLSNIKPETSPGQMELFDFMDNDLPAENRELMKVIDQINRKFPKTISVAAIGLGGSGIEPWKPTASNRSRRYTTDWDELVIVKC